jgi:hypothetical protein
MMDGGQRKGGKRFGLKTGCAVLAVVAVLAGLTALHLLKSERNVERRLEALRAAGYPTSLAELAEYHKLPPGVPNAAEIYAQAFAAFVLPPEADPSFWGMAGLPERGAPLSEATVRLISESLAENQQCLALLHQAGEVEQCRYDWDLNEPLPDFTIMGDCSRLLQFAALLRAHQGRIEEALACIKDGLRLGESMRRQPLAISQIVRSHNDGKTLRALEHVLCRVVLTERQLIDLDNVLTTIQGHLDFADIMITERGHMLGNCRTAFAARKTDPSPRAAMLWLPGAKERTFADILDWMDTCIEAAQLPETQRLARFRQIRREVESLSDLHTIIKGSVPVMSPIVELDLMFRARLRLVRTALALERYRLTTGKLPPGLEALVPQYLEQAPIDPFDGQAIRYRRTTPGCILYSVDRDGQDNGGREHNGNNASAPYDLCFIVTR